MACFSESQIRPLEGVSSPAMIRNKLDFPEPEGPIKATKFPVDISKLILDNIEFEPNF